MGYKGLNSPISGNRVKNPLTNGKTVEKLRKQHTETLSKTGLRPPKSPLK